MEAGARPRRRAPAKGRSERARRILATAGQANCFTARASAMPPIVT